MIALAPNTLALGVRPSGQTALRSTFKGNAKVLAPRAVAVARPARSTAPVQALFGFGKTKLPEADYYICIDCGWIYDGREDLRDMPEDYKCAKCTSTKKRFRAYKAEIRGRPKNDLKAMRARMQERDW